MSDINIEQELLSVERKKACEQKDQATFRSNWRKLRQVNQKLNEQLEIKKSKIILNSTDADIIYQTMIDRYQSQMDSVKNEYLQAENSIETFKSKNNILSIFSKDKTDIKNKLQKNLTDKKEKYFYMNSEMPYISKEYKVHSKRIARENQKKNNQMLSHLQPLIDHVDGLGLVLKAIDAGDQAVSNCILKANVELAIRVARIWLLIKNNERIGSGDRDIYWSATRSGVSGEIDENSSEAFILRRTVEEVVIVPRAEKQNSNQSNGITIDADFEIVNDEDLKIIKQIGYQTGDETKK